MLCEPAWHLSQDSRQAANKQPDTRTENSIVAKKRHRTHSWSACCPFCRLTQY